jgi:hypothetical protein
MYSIYEMGAAPGITFFTRVTTKEIIPNTARISQRTHFFSVLLSTADERSLDVAQIYGCTVDPVHDPGKAPKFGTSDNLIRARKPSRLIARRLAATFFR